MHMLERNLSELKEKGTSSKQEINCFERAFQNKTIPGYTSIVDDQPLLSDCLSDIRCDSNKNW